MATLGRGGYEADLPPAKTWAGSSGGTDQYDVTEISSNTTWNTSNDIITDVVIHSPAILTINNSAVIGMAAGRRIIVERGARLVVDNATLTNSCGAMWQGIQAIGTWGSPQSTTNSGTVILKNGATIENARAGVANWNMITGDWGTQGGIIVASTGTQFHNCTSAALFNPFQNTTASGLPIADKSSFSDCYFEWDNDHKDHNPPLWQVGLTDVHGLIFAGCSFENGADATNRPDLFQKGSGIVSWDASYRVVGRCKSLSFPCTSIERSSFTNLAEGVRAGCSVDGTTNVTVDEADFDGCSIGIHNSGNNNFIATRNRFDIGDGASIKYLVFDTPRETDDPCYHNIGIYTDGTAQLQIEENSFSGVAVPLGTNLYANGRVGTLTRNSGMDDKVIYRNSYDHLDHAAMALGINSNTPNYVQYYPVPFEDISGLTYQCNSFSNNGRDILVANWPYMGVGISRAG